MRKAIVSKRFIITILSVVVIAVAASGAIFLAKGYRLSPHEGTIAGTGILSITSVPDQASVYLDDHLTTATNTNINSLPPKKYQVKIVKEGYITWEKEVEVKEGLVTDIKATLFRGIPSVYPLTYTGAINPILSPDNEKMSYIVPGTEKRSGLWVWPMTDSSIAFARGGQPVQIGAPTIDYTKAKMRWSADSSQLLVSFPDKHLLFDANRMNDPARDITALLEPTLRTWDDEDRQAKNLKLQLIKDLTVRKTASAAAVLNWSPDETKFVYSTDGKTDYKVVDLNPNKGLTAGTRTYDLPDADRGYSWLPDSEHLVFVQANAPLPSPSPSAPLQALNQPKASPSGSPIEQTFAKIAVIEFDGFNKSEIYAGNFDPNSVFVWPDGSRLVIVSSYQTATASTPNLFGINLK